MVIFATPRNVTKVTEYEWAEQIRAAHGFELVVMSREEIVTLLQFLDSA